MDLWIAHLADGSTKEEEWLPGHISPWQRLMEYCKKQNTYVRGLRLAMGNDSVNCPNNAEGYWQAHGMPTVQGVECDEELHKWRGIGYVVGDTVNILWAARDPHTHHVVTWRDSRPAANQMQIIWAPKKLVIPLEDLMEIPRATSEVRGIREFSDKIVDSVGGLKEVYVPEHHH